ncbi:hypothetical protein [Mycobacterium kyorinense]|nr:hypothetical protein [Mycobacterium kyorinense]
MSDILMLMNAYFTTPYIKIRGKIYAFHVKDSQPDQLPEDTAATPDNAESGYDPAPDSYGGTAPANKFWWLLIVTMAMCVLAVIIQAEDKPLWLAPVMGTVGVMAGIILGYGDASWRYSVARGQRVQFIIIAVITAGVFTILYLAAYYAGKRWPWRSRKSTEYRAHPRHQKR